MAKQIETAAEAVQFVKDEQGRIQKLIDRVRDTMKVVPHIKAKPNMDSLIKIVMFGAGPSIGIVQRRDGHLEILYTPGVSLETLPKDEMLSGVIAHEVGHLLNGDVGQPKSLLSKTKLRETEYAADRVAYKFGFGPGLISAFETISTKYKSLDSETSSTHPAISDRIRRLRAYDERKEVAA